MFAGGELGVVEAVGDYTVRYVFPNPNYLFFSAIAQLNLLSSGCGCSIAYSPSKYLKQFHIKYNPDADQMAKDAGFEGWVAQYLKFDDAYVNVDRPTTRPWMFTANMQQQRMIISRNPYFWATDQRGNQLPYIDRIVFDLIPDGEVVNLKALAGEIDMQGRHLRVANLPVLKAGEEKGNYKILKVPGFGGHAGINFNLAWEGTEKEWISNKKFRQALSMSIDRQEINDLHAYGESTIRGPVPPKGHLHYPGDEAANAYQQYDTEAANAVLDEIGLDKLDSDGFRIDPNTGEALTMIISVYTGQNVEMFNQVGSYFEAVGVKTIMDVVTRALWTTRGNANGVMLCSGGANTVFFYQGQAKYTLPVQSDTACENPGNPFARWVESGGTEGTEPPAWLKEVIEMFQKGQSSPVDEGNAIAREIFTIFAEQQHFLSLLSDGTGFFVVSNAFKNVQPFIGGWPLRSPSNAYPEQFFIKQ